MSILKYKAVLFDFDYTLGDSTDGIVMSVNYGLEKLGYPAAERESIRKTIGLTLINTYFQLIPDGSKEEAVCFDTYFKEKADHVMVENTVLLPHALDTLKGLKKAGIKVGIVTTKYRHRIEKILKKYEASDLVDIIIGSDSVKNAKPDPEGTIAAMKSLDVSPSQVLYVGDSLVDAGTAKNAGVDFACVLTGTTQEKEFASYPCVRVMKDLSILSELY